jgi:hypothetical protein
VGAISPLPPSAFMACSGTALALRMSVVFVKACVVQRTVMLIDIMEGDL